MTVSHSKEISEFFGVIVGIRTEKLSNSKIHKQLWKILSLGESKLKICVFKMKLYADIDQLPKELSTLEYDLFMCQYLNQQQ
jgi:hypothetical protein